MPDEPSAERPPAGGSAPRVAGPLHELMAVIQDRKQNPPPHSYTTQLFSGGVSAIGDKIREEAGEVIEAAGEPGDTGHAHLVHEAADLVYHLLVLLGYRGVDWREIETELARRAGISGLDEKESRNGPSSGPDNP